MIGTSQIIIYFVLKALIITIISELLILLVQKESNYKIYLLSIVINIITNVSLNIGIQFINPKHYYLIVGLLEVLIVFIEAILYDFIYNDLKKSLRISCLCNIMSFLMGFILL